MAHPTIEQLAARMVFAGFPGLTLDEGFDRLLQRGIGGAILFKRNVGEPRDVADLCAQLKTRAPGPLVTCVDQEGGRVARFRDGFTPLPSARTTGLANDPALALELGRLMGRELRAVNVDLDFAPVLDVDTNPANPVIADRSFGPTPQRVIDVALPLLRGLQEVGVAACGKHFPGHGDTAQDSHYNLPRLPHAMDRLEQIELKPFEAAVRAGVACIMTSHVIFEPLDATYPATMSRATLDGILRDRMNFDGVVISDDLEMKAIANHFAFEDVVVRCVNAGVDALTICHNLDLQNRAIDVIVRAVADGQISQERVEQANRRIANLARSFAKPPATFDRAHLATAVHGQVVEAITAKAGASAHAASQDPTDFRR